MVVGVEQGEEVSEHPSNQTVPSLTGTQEAKQLQWVHGALRVESEESGPRFLFSGLAV